MESGPKPLRVRIEVLTAGDHPAVTVLWLKLSKVLPKYPDVKVEINMEGGLIDIAAQRYDAGVRLGEQVAKDMLRVVRVSSRMPSRRSSPRIE